MSLVKRSMEGKAHIGHLGYSIMALMYRKAVKSVDKKRLKTMKDPANDMVITKNIRYSKGSRKYHLLDVYKLKDFPSKGTIFVVHGGGLIYGKKDLNRFSNMELTRLGYDVVAISYSLAPGKTLFYQVRDCLNALDFVIKNKDKYNLNLNNLYLFGDSAGGFLNLIIAGLLKNKELMKEFIKYDLNVEINGIGLVSPMTYIECKGDVRGIQSRVCISRKEKRLKSYEYLLDPKKFIDKNFNNTIISTSDLDFIKNHSHDLYNVLKENNVKCELCDYVSRGINLEHVFPVTYPRLIESQDFYSKVDKFFISLKK